MQRAHRQGWTLLEVTIVAAIIGLLLSLILVATQSAREASRRAQCLSNLRQLGLPIIQQANKLPRVRAVTFTNRYQHLIFGNPFVFVAQELSYPVKNRDEFLQIGDDETSVASPPSVFRCPSSDKALGYRLNFGVKPIVTIRVRDTPGQLFSHQKTGRSLSEVTDGLSNTVLISERMTPSGRPRRNRSIAVANGVPRFEDMESYCESSFRRNVVIPNPDHWWSTRVECFGYDHTRVPNADTVDCLVINAQQSFSAWTNIAARSEHTGGVNCGWLDGGVRFVNSSIDLQLWQSFGTSQGGEPVQTEQN